MTGKYQYRTFIFKTSYIYFKVRDCTYCFLSFLSGTLPIFLKFHVNLLHSKIHFMSIKTLELSNLSKHSYDILHFFPIESISLMYFSLFIHFMLNLFSHLIINDIGQIDGFFLIVKFRFILLQLYFKTTS